MGTHGQSSFTPFYISPEEATKSKLCQHCNLLMEVKQINLTEAIRQCSNCFFSSNNAGNCSIEFIRRSFQDIGKDCKDWTSGNLSEEEEIYKLKSWIEEVNLNLNKFEADSDEEITLPSYSPFSKSVKDISQKGLHTNDECNLNALEELDAALKKASLQNSSEDDFPFSLMDLFGPLNSNAEFECPKNQNRNDFSSQRVSQHTTDIEPGDNTDSGSAVIPNKSSSYAEKNQLIVDKGNSVHPSTLHPGHFPFSKSLPFEEENSSNKFLCCPQNIIGHGSCEIPSESGSNVQNSISLIKNANSTRDRLVMEESISKISSHGILPDMKMTETGFQINEHSTGDPSMSNKTPNIDENISEYNNHLSPLKNRHFGRKTYLPAKQILRSPHHTEKVTFFSVVGDPFQLTGNSPGEDFCVDVSLPNLNLHPCMPKFYDEPSWTSRERQKLHSPAKVKLTCFAGGSSFNHNQCSSDQNIPLKILKKKNNSLVIDSDVSDAPGNSSQESLLSFVNLGPHSGHRRFTKEENNSLGFLSETRSDFLNHLKQSDCAENEGHIPVFPAAMNIEANVCSAMGERLPSENCSAKEIVIIIPATEDIPLEMLDLLSGNEQGEIKLSENMFEFPAFEFSSKTDKDVRLTAQEQDTTFVENCSTKKINKDLQIYAEHSYSDFVMDCDMEKVTAEDSEDNGFVKDCNISKEIDKDIQIITEDPSESFMKECNIVEDIQLKFADQNARTNSEEDFSCKDLQAINIDVSHGLSFNFSFQIDGLSSISVANAPNSSSFFHHNINKSEKIHKNVETSASNFNSFENYSNSAGESKTTGTRVCERSAFLSCDEDDQELISFRGTKFKPKPGKDSKPVRKCSDILGEGNYVNLFHIIKKEIQEMQTKGGGKEQSGKSYPQLYETV